MAWPPSIFAEDLKNQRSVAIKVLKPEIAAAALGPNCFLREIQIAEG